MKRSDQLGRSSVEAKNLRKAENMRKEGVLLYFYFSSPLNIVAT